MSLRSLSTCERINKTFCALCLKPMQASLKIVMLEANNNVL